MTDTAWLTDNWPWWVVIFFLVVYELYALVTKKGRTLSRMVWASSTRYPWMVPIALSFVAWLVIHFWVTRGDVVPEVLWTAIAVGVIWLTYFTVRKRDLNGHD